MQTYELLVEGRSIRSNSDDDTLVRTSVGIDQIHVLFDSAEWLSFPLTVTFAQRGVDPVTSSLTVSELEDSAEWAAEATCKVPYEVIRMVGPIRVTFQGTDSSGNHIITAYGEPLSVEEAGDVTLGEIPADAPTVDQWTQAYADAQTLLNEVQAIKNNLQSQLDSMVAQARAQVTDDSQEIVDQILETYAVPATTVSLGLMQVGSGLSVTSDGVVSAVVTNGITAEEQSQIANLASLAYYCFDATFDDDGLIEPTAQAKATAIPLADLVDGTTVTVDDDGKLAIALAVADGTEY